MCILEKIFEAQPKTRTPPLISKTPCTIPATEMDLRNTITITQHEMRTSPLIMNDTYGTVHTIPPLATTLMRDIGDNIVHEKKDVPFN